MEFSLFSGQFCSGRVMDLIPCKLLKMVCKDPSFTLHVILPMLFNKDKTKPFVRDRHTDTVSDSHRRMGRLRSQNLERHKFRLLQQMGRGWKNQRAWIKEFKYALAHGKIISRGSPCIYFLNSLLGT